MDCKIPLFHASIWTCNSSPAPPPLKNMLRRPWDGYDDNEEDRSSVAQRDIDITSADWMRKDSRALAILKLLQDNSQLKRIPTNALE